MEGWKRMRVNAPVSGGEPLCRLAVLSDGSKRLPGITQGACLNLALRTDLTKIGENQERW
jgi:hypothetical protein